MLHVEPGFLLASNGAYAPSGALERAYDDASLCGGAIGMRVAHGLRVVADYRAVCRRRLYHQAARLLLRH